MNLQTLFLTVNLLTQCSEVVLNVPTIGPQIAILLMWPQHVLQAHTQIILYYPY